MTALRERVARAFAPAAVVAVSALILWPALIRRGSLMFLDLMLTDRVRIPPGMWGLGPELPRRQPAFVPMAVVGWATGGELAGRVGLAAALVGLGVGVGRLSRCLRGGARRPVGEAIAGSTVLLSPFVLTRMSTGHLTTLAAVAVVPWLLVQFIDRGVDGIRSKASALMALGGIVGGTYSALLLVALIRRRREIRRSAPAWCARNGVWLVPMIVVAAQGLTSISSATRFRPRLDRLHSVLGLVLGSGYWDRAANAIGHPWAVAAVSLCAIGLAAAGWETLRLAGSSAALRVMRVAMVIGYGVPAFAATPGLRWVFDRLVDSPVGAPLREPHRLVGLGIVPFVALAVVGVETSVDAALHRWGQGVASLAALVVGSCAALALAFSGLPATHRRLDPVPLPTAWQQARSTVEADEGTTLVAPWSEYVSLPFGDGRRVLNPIPELFDGDIISSADPQISRPVEESAEPRARVGRSLVTALVEGHPDVEAMARAGIKWVVVLGPRPATPGLPVVVAGDGLRLLRVPSSHSARPIHRVGPFARADAGVTTDSSRLAGAALRGWIGARGLLGGTDDGWLKDGSGNGVLMYLPAIPTFLAFLVWIVMLTRKKREL